MISVTDRKMLFGTIWCLFLFSAIAGAQTYHFHNYGTDTGMPGGFVYTINQDSTGYLLVGTGKGLARFDGFEFYHVSFPDSVSDRFMTSSLKDKDGNLWFGCNDGSVFSYREDKLEALTLPNSRSISMLLNDPEGNIYIFPQGGNVFRFDPENINNIITYPVDPGLLILSADFTSSGDLVIGTQGEIRIYMADDDSLKLSGTLEVQDYSNVTAIHRLNSQNNFLVGTEGNGLFRLVISPNGNRLERFAGSRDLDLINIQSISSDLEKSYWLATNESGVIRVKLSPSGNRILSYTVLDKNSGLISNNTRIVFQDMEGDYWIGLFGDGLSLINSLAFSTITLGDTRELNNVIYINQIGSAYFFGTPAGYFLYDFNINKVISFISLMKYTGRSEIASYCLDGEGNIWFGTKGEGLYIKTPSGKISRFFATGSSGKDYITDIKLTDRYIWLGSLDGAIILDRKTGRIKGEYNTDSGLPHNNINQIYITREGNGAIATKTDKLFLINPEKGIIPGKLVMSGPTLNEVTSFCESDDGKLWAATKGNGVFEFFDDSVRSFSRADLLASDYCYSIFIDSVNRVWVGHDGGFSRYNRNTGIMRTFGVDYSNNGICNPGAIYESHDGKVLIGTTSGIIAYDRGRDSKLQIGPINNINYVEINNIRYPYRKVYSLPYNKRYRIQVSYVGINLRDPDKVYYRTMLENYDDEWSQLTVSREMTYSPRDGHYKFMMKSVNEEGLSSDTAAEFELIIKKPFFRSWWFIISVSLFITGIVIFIIKVREKSQKKTQAYLENELEARTSIVMKQKGEIELQNIEITDSINYAKRIQTSILPDINKLAGVFADAFLIFRPRDIVSGDFYWFDKFDEDRYIIVCADSTGHGVPGAFMSMIGATLLQDIITRQRISKPSKILKMLDQQIFDTLNQNVELGVSNDGMDMVVCEISVKARHIRFASAMRPVILVLDGESYYIKGNRSSVGGESVIEKFFDDQEYYLNEGDTIYMFSDGLPDQFGGTDGKKMKIARLKKLIEDVSKLPMTGQKEVISKFYDEWKGEFDQVDDVLLIGVKF